jgi:hypothetical protein
MWDPNNPEQLEARLTDLREYADDIRDFEAKAEAFKGLRDIVISGLVRKGIPTRTIAEAAGISHVRVAAIAKRDSAA